MVWILIIVQSLEPLSKGLYCTKRSQCTMRPEISDRNIERLKEWSARKRGFEPRNLGTRGGQYSYTVDDALDDLLKEAGF